MVKSGPLSVVQEEKVTAIGSTVVIDMGGKEFTYTMVGPVEANPLEGKISHESPIGKELLGRKSSETFDFNGKKVTVKSIK